MSGPSYNVYLHVYLIFDRNLIIYVYKITTGYSLTYILLSFSLSFSLWALQKMFSIIFAFGHFPRNISSCSAVSSLDSLKRRS